MNAVVIMVNVMRGLINVPVKMLVMIGSALGVTRIQKSMSSKEQEGGPEKTEARRNEVRNKCEHKNILDIGCNDPKTKWCNDCGAICFDYNPDYWRLPLHQR